MDKLQKRKIKKFIKNVAKFVCRVIFPPFRRVEKSRDEYRYNYYSASRRVLKGNKNLMEQIEFLKFRARSLDELHESVVQKKWPHDGSFRNKKCLEPFRNISILPRGEVYTCCSAFLKHDYYIGNIYENEFDDIWNSERALKLRYSVSNGNFEYCQSICKYLCGQRSGVNGCDATSPIVDREESDFKESYKDCKLFTTPQVINLSCDKTCNLYCSSCRSSREVISNEDADKLYNTLVKVVRPMLKDCKVLEGLASGELFASSACSRFYKTLNANEFPGLTLSIITNLQLLTPAKWDEYKNLHEFPLKLIVSVDAANKETYEKLRRGANWERLVENLMFFREWRLRAENKIESLSLNFIVQKENYKEIEDFCAFGQKVGADQIWFQQITNWGTYTDDEFKKVNVFDRDNPCRAEAAGLLKSVLEKKWSFSIMQNSL